MEQPGNGNIRVARLLILATMFALNTSCVHCHCKQNLPPSHVQVTTNTPVATPPTVSNDEPINGSKNYPATYQGDYKERKIYLISLPHGTPDTTPISSIEIWVNTTNLEGQRVGTTYTCDELQIVNDDNPEWTVIRSQDIYRVEVAGTSAGSDKVTPQDGFPVAADFLFKQGGDGFDLIEKTVRQGRIFIGIKQHQPPGHRLQKPSVDSAKVEIRP